MVLAWQSQRVSISSAEWLVGAHCLNWCTCTNLGDVERSLLHTTDRVNGTDTFGGPDLQLEGFSAAPKASTQLMGSFCQAESTHRPRGAKERGKQAL